MSDYLDVFDKLEIDDIDHAGKSVAGFVEISYCAKPKFSAGKLRTEGGKFVSFSIKGLVSANEFITLRGAWENDPKYGWQFVGREVVYETPSSPHGLAKWLEWNAPGIGEAKANQLLARFGVGVMDVFTSTPQLIASAIRIPLHSVKAVADLWNEQRGRVQAITALAAHGLTHTQCESIVQRFGTTAPRIVETDPYELAGEVEGIGFKLADEIAAKLGIVGTDPRRLRGSLAAFVRERYTNGHTATPLPTALTGTAKATGATEAAIAAVLPAVVADKKLTRHGTGAVPRDTLSTANAAFHERAVWDFLRNSQERNPLAPCREGGEEQHAEAYRQCGNLLLDDSQLAAVVNAFRYRVSSVTGGAGSGKSSTMRAIVKAFIHRGERVHLVAPTGKAARRLSDIIGQEAHTIHRLLQWQGKERRFLHNSVNRLHSGLYVTDELSMVSSDLAHHFLTALPERSTLVLVGDVQQLPPVGPGAVLRDILAHNLTPVTRLDRCHRQAGILKQNCAAILSGRISPTETGMNAPPPWLLDDKLSDDKRVLDTIWNMFRVLFPAWGYGPTDWVFLAPKLDGPLGVRRLNLILQVANQRRLGNNIAVPVERDWNERPKFYVGDRVIQTRNDYNISYTDNRGILREGVMNGTTGVVRSVDDSGEVEVEFEDGHVSFTRGQAGSLQLAYCLTTHKFQGSQIPCAVVIIPKGCGGFIGRNYVYTACTRATTTCVLMGDGATMQQAVNRTNDDERDTLLSWYAQNDSA